MTTGVYWCGLVWHCRSEDNSKMRPPHPTSASFAQIFVATWMRPSSTHCHHADPVPLGPPLGRSGPSHTFRLHCDMHAPPRRRPSPTRISHCSSEDQIGLASSSHIITALEQQAYCAVSLCGPDHGTAPLLCMPSVDRQNDLRGKTTCAAECHFLFFFHSKEPDETVSNA